MNLLENKTYSQFKLWSLITNTKGGQKREEALWRDSFKLLLKDMDQGKMVGAGRMKQWQGWLTGFQKETKVLMKAEFY